MANDDDIEVDDDDWNEFNADMDREEEENFVWHRDIRRYEVSLEKIMSFMDGSQRCLSHTRPEVQQLLLARPVSERKDAVEVTLIAVEANWHGWQRVYQAAKEAKCRQEAKKNSQQKTKK